MEATHQRRMHGFRKPLGLPRHLILFIPRKRRKLIILGPNQNRDGRLPTSPPSIPQHTLSASIPTRAHALNDSGTDLVKPPSLSVPLFDTIQGRLACQVKHEQDGHCVVRDEREHGDEFSLAA
jgi:hypothetical protein